MTVHFIDPNKKVTTQSPHDQELVTEVAFEIGTVAEVYSDIKKATTRILDIVRAHDARADMPKKEGEQCEN